MNRITNLLLTPMAAACLLLSACSEAPSQPTPATTVASAKTPVQKTCTSDYSTGSHLNKTVVCTTDDERDEMNQQTNQNMATFRALSANGKAGGQ